MRASSHVHALRASRRFIAPLAAAPACSPFRSAQSPTSSSVLARRWQHTEPALRTWEPPAKEHVEQHRRIGWKRTVKLRKALSRPFPPPLDEVAQEFANKPRTVPVPELPPQDMRYVFDNLTEDAQGELRARQRIIQKEWEPPVAPPPMLGDWVVERLTNGNLPVNHAVSHAGKRHTTEIHAFRGDTSAMVRSLKLLLGPYVEVHVKLGRIVIKGDHVAQVKRWLLYHGF